MPNRAALVIKLSDRQGLQFTAGKSRRWASFHGSLWNSDSKLNGTAFVLEMYEGTTYNPELPVPEAAIGVVNATPHAQPSDDKEAPFHATVVLARSDFDAALHLINVTLDEDHLVVARLEVQSEQFYAAQYYPAIENIDLSGGFQGFVVEFNLTRSLVRSIPPFQRPVRLPKKIHERRPATGISVAVSSVYIDYSMPSGYLSRLICDGFIKTERSGQDHLKGSAAPLSLPNTLRMKVPIPRSHCQELLRGIRARARFQLNFTTEASI
jgi:hypothetical protein